MKQAKPLALYRIKTLEGLYSCGGSWPKFSKTGKLWRKSMLNLHLHLVSEIGSKDTYKDCVVEKLEINIKGSYPIDNFIWQETIMDLMREKDIDNTKAN